MRKFVCAISTCAFLGGLAADAAADDLFVLVDESNRLPVDSTADTKDTLDVELADVDDDGDLDMFLCEGSGALNGFQNLLWINDGTGVFTDETAARLPAVDNNSTEVDFADVDGDGDLDAVVANLGANQLLLNDGDGFFTEGVLPQATPPGPPGFSVPFPPFFIEVSAEAVFADIDGDGDPDILISNENPLPFGPPGDANRVLINDGAGSFSEGVGRLPFVIDNSAGMVPGDIDGDGDLDIIVVNIGSDVVLINDGTGFFSDETAARYPAESASTRKIALGDVDGDGDLDIVAGNSRGQQDVLFLNDGTGVFTDETATSLPVDTATNTDIDLADLDGDGDLDLVVTNVGDFVFGHGFLGEPNRILQNDGNGVFTDITLPRLELVDDRSTNAELGDINGDGVVDFVFANSGGVDMPNLPPPDGRERVYIRNNCELETELCHQTMLDGLAATIASLDTATFPAGDMTSQNAFVNDIRKTILGKRARKAQRALDRHRPFAYWLNVGAVLLFSDGTGSPPDWVAGDAAETLQAYGDFALDVLFAHGL